MPLTHQDKAAIVTGIQRGIDHGIAKLFAKRGARVVIVNRSDATEAAAATGNGAVAANVASKADRAWIATHVESSSVAPTS